jgi:hypothetical protein
MMRGDQLVPRRRLAGVLFAVTAAVGAGCARGTPVVAPTPVVLNVPPAPPRVIAVPPERIVTVDITPVEETADTPPERVSRPTPRADSNARQASPAAAETEAETAAAAPSAPPPPAATAPVLRTPQTADESEADRRIREVLARTSATLGRVNPATLAREARTQHETARRFVDQAQAALIERNFVFASYLADKAETLARGLSR